MAARWPSPLPPDLGGADQAEQAGATQGIEGGAGIGAGAVDLAGGGGDDIGDDGGERGHVGRQARETHRTWQNPPEDDGRKTARRRRVGQPERREAVQWFARPGERRNVLSDFASD